MIMFAILFGLSMDYEVFLLSRVREEYVRTGDSHRSVVDGLAATARVITSAALIMISVFAAFLLTPDVEIKMFGVGLTVAVLVDATVVRMVLVPGDDGADGRRQLVAARLARPAAAPPRPSRGRCPWQSRRARTRTASWSSCSDARRRVPACRDRRRRRRRGAVRLVRSGLPRRGGDDGRAPAAGGRAGPSGRRAGRPRRGRAAPRRRAPPRRRHRPGARGRRRPLAGPVVRRGRHRAGPAPRRGQALPRGDRAGLPGSALAGVGRDAPPPGRADGRRRGDRLRPRPARPGGGRAPPVGRPGQGPGRRRPSARHVPRAAGGAGR